MLIGLLFAIIVGMVLVIGGLQTLGETRLTIIFPIISAVAVLAFLAHCAFNGPSVR